MNEFYIVHAERISVSPSFGLEVLVFGDTEFKETDQQPTGHLAAFSRVAGSRQWTRINQDGPDVPHEDLDAQAEMTLPTRQVYIAHLGERAWIVREGERVYRFDPQKWHEPLGNASGHALGLWDWIIVAEGNLIPWRTR